MGYFDLAVGGGSSVWLCLEKVSIGEKEAYFVVVGGWGVGGGGWGGGKRGM
jgi:hypothetical protein